MLTLNGQQFRHFVQDNWGWKGQLVSSNSTYVEWLD